MSHEYHIIYSVQYYPRFHVTAVGLGTYYPWIRWHYCILHLLTESLTAISCQIGVTLYTIRTFKLIKYSNTVLNTVGAITQFTTVH
jgi:hypothetical protein